ncbi:MAG: hypothetical protein KC592_09550 [Nitrospira sp.]|nr:hypothetical protein [Nitrospira sp.]
MMRTHDEVTIESMRKTEIVGPTAKGKPMGRWLHYFGVITMQITLLILVSLIAALSTPAIAGDTPVEGGPGGNPFRADCPKGSYLIGLAGRTGNWVDQLAPICAPWQPTEHVLGASSIGKSHGTSTGGKPQQKTCPSDQVIYDLGFYISIGDQEQHKFIDSIYANCKTIKPPPHGDSTFRFTSQGSPFKKGNPITTPGIELKSPYREVYCPPHEVAIGFHGRAGLFLDALGLICGPPPVPAKPGVMPPSQAKNIPSALPTAPTINSPAHKGYIVKGQGVFKITPSKYLTGTHALYQLRWLNPPASQQGKEDFFTQEVPMSLIASPGGLDAPQILLAKGTWEIRVRINQPKVGDWSDWVRFEYYLQHPALTTKPNVPPPVTGASPCNAGFVPRLAQPTDHVCVTPESRDRVQQENATAASRRNPQGPYGPNTCLTGFVWREAFAGDLVCVTPEIRQFVRQENALNTSRSPEIPGTTLIRPRGIGESQSKDSAPDAEQKP